MAICNGSVSPSKSTNTGAFILDSIGQPQCSQYNFQRPQNHNQLLHPPSVKYEQQHIDTSPPNQTNIPNLQRPRPQHPRPLILCHIRRRRPLLRRNLLILQSSHRILLDLLLLRPPLTIHLYNRSATVRAICCRDLRIRIVCSTGGAGGLRGAFVVVGVVRRERFFVFEFGLVGLVAGEGLLGGEQRGKGGDG